MYILECIYDYSRRKIINIVAWWNFQYWIFIINFCNSCKILVFVCCKKNIPVWCLNFINIKFVGRNWGKCQVKKLFLIYIKNFGAVFKSNILRNGKRILYSRLNGCFSMCLILLFSFHIHLLLMYWYILLFWLAQMTLSTVQLLNKAKC